ncbi:MAG: DM13 domain-containing protein [Actinomycetota bacterium]|nr:DM13 domain-containing protein [Actinomycetota bacterium]
MSQGLPVWARVLLAVAVVTLFILGLWLVGGVVTDNFDVAMALTALWFAGFGALALGVASRRPDLRLAVGGTFLVTAAVVGGFLAWSTLRDKTVDEKVVTGRAASGTETEAAAGEAPPSGNVTLAGGKFRGIAHETVGRAAVVKLESGERKLTLTGFETDAGPDLFVYLVAGGNPEDTDSHKSLGSLKGNKGNQQYTIPAGVDLGKYDTVVIWCRAFSVAFGAAELSAV